MNKIAEMVARLAKILWEKLRLRGVVMSFRDCAMRILLKLMNATTKKTHVLCPATTEERSASTKQAAGCATNEKVKAMTGIIVNHIKSHYDVRYNVLDERPELRERSDENGAFRPLDSFAFHSLVVELRLAGCDSWDSNIEHVLCSRLMKLHHPFRHYMQELPAWDGKDRTEELAQRVSDDPLWAKFFHVWLRGMAAQWEGRDMLVSNQYAPILISRQQGLRKSTFCRLLVPPALRPYYTDKFELTAQSSPELKIYQCGLINMDEFDRYSERQMSRLKNIMQLSSLRLRRPFARYSTDEKRLASFIGTSNSTELLTDPSGSRRFFCQEISSPIDCDTPIEYEQLFAQLKAENAEGLPCHFSKEEEAEIQDHNRAYYVISSIEDTLCKMYEPAANGSTDGKWITPTEMFDKLRRAYGSTLRGATVRSVSRALIMQGAIRRHTRRGTAFFVKEKIGKR